MKRSRSRKPLVAYVAFLIVVLVSHPIAHAEEGVTTVQDNDTQTQSVEESLLSDAEDPLALPDDDVADESSDDVATADAVDVIEEAEEVEVAQSEQAAPTLTASAHVQGLGWRASGTGSVGSALLGTTGRSLRMEALKISVSGGSVSYRAHVQGEGWQAWRSDGQEAGSTGRSRRLEALRVRLSGGLESDWSVQYRAHVQGLGWMGWAADGGLCGTAGLGRRLEAVEVRVVPRGTALPSGGGAAYRDAGLSVQAHVQGVGWQAASRGYSAIAGTTGRSLRLEALRIGRPASDLGGSVVYRAHVQGEGWQAERRDGQLAGSVGKSRRVEAVSVRLTGELADAYDVWYRLHVQGAGWLDWAHNGEVAGSEGLSLRVEAVEIRLLADGSSAPSSKDRGVSAKYVNSDSAIINYAVATDGGSWSKWVLKGTTAGSSGGSAIKQLKANISGMGGSVSYAVHLASLGWQGPVGPNAVAGKDGKDVQAIRISLSGDVSKLFDVWYRAYVKGVGWMSWAKNGSDAGSVGVGLPMVAMQVTLRSKAQGAPGATSTPLYRKFTSGDSELDAILNTIVSKKTGTGSNALRKAYDYIATFGYRSQNKWPAGGWQSWSRGYAKEMYKTGSGNCYRYASLMCWVARKLGYDASVVCGEVLTSSGRQPHGWCEVHQGGKTYVIDCERHRFIPGRDFCMVTYENAPVYYYK